MYNPVDPFEATAVLEKILDRPPDNGTVRMRFLFGTVYNRSNL
jgi:hypothetical protein